MEILIILALAVGGLIYAFRSSFKDKNNSPFERNTLPLRRPPTPGPFDEKNSSPTPNPSVVEGAAYIVDGDTLTISKKQIRLFGVDAPELNHPYGKKAKWALVSLCKGQVVKAEVTAVDDHGRMVAKCYLQDGRDLSAEMVKQGLAIDWPKFSGGKYYAMEVPDVRKKLWLADARQKGRMHVWKKFEANQAARDKANQ